MTSCLLPKPPGHTVIANKSTHHSFGIEIYTLKPRELGQYRHSRSSTRQRSRDNDSLAQKNLLFVAVDDTVQTQYQDALKKAYQTDQVVRLEDVSWWRFAPQFKNLYANVVKIPLEQFHADSLEEGLRIMEDLDQKYDIMLLTHGIPNHITASKGEDFISYKSLENWDFITQLDFVFMQGCFSETLALDWIKLGARDVLSYKGWNRNFFYVDFFIKEYKKDQNVGRAYHEVNKTIEEKIRRAPIYKTILKELGLSFEEYFQLSDTPIYDTVKEKSF